MSPIVLAPLVGATSVIILRYHWLPWPIGLLGIPVVVFSPDTVRSWCRRNS